MAELKPLEAAVTQIADLPLRHFGKPVGRDDLLRALLQRLRQNQPLVLHGAPGVGKTTVAATIASVTLQHSSQAVLWLPVHEPSLAELLVRIGRAYSATDICNAPNPLRQAEAVAALLRENQPLLVLDGAISSDVLSQLHHRCAQGIPMVVTSAKALPGGDWRNQALGSLPEDDALLLFKQKAGLQDDAADDAALAIARSLDSEAFPLSLAARSMIISRQSPQDYLEALAGSRADDEVSAFDAALSLSLDALSPPLLDLLHLLAATARGEASGGFLRDLADLPASAVEGSMTILSRLFLVDQFQRGGEAYYRLHSLVRGSLLERADADDALPGLREKVLGAAGAYIDASADDESNRLMIELDNLIASAKVAAEAGDLELTAGLAQAVAGDSDLVEQAGYAYELALLRALSVGETLEFEDEAADEPEADAGESIAPDSAGQPTAEDVPESESADDSTLIAIDDEELQSINIDQLRTALNVARENGETLRQAQILNAIAKVQINQGREDDALLSYGDALEICATAGDADGLLDMLDRAAGLLVSSAGARSAIDQINWRAAFSGARKHEDSERVLDILGAIGKIQIDENHQALAVSAHNAALEIHEARDDKARILETLDMLAGLLILSDAAVTALNHIQRALHLAAELDDIETEMFLRKSLGDAHRALGETVTAVEAYELALTIARNRGDQQNEAQILYRLGLAQLDAGDPRQAIVMLESAIDYFKQQSNRSMEGQVLQGLGAVHVKLQRWSEAINFHTSALYVAREVGRRDEETQQLRVLGSVLIEANRLPEALTSYRQALHVAYEEEDAAQIVPIIAELVSLMMRSPNLSSIAELMIEDGLRYDDDDRELLRLKGEVTLAKEAAQSRGVALAVVAGTAREYAANAYNYN